MSGVSEPCAVPGSGKRDHGLDLIRIVGIVTVIAVIHTSSLAALGMDDGLYGVLLALSLGLIMCISGYLTAVRHPDLSSGLARRSFAAKRLLRLYPLYAAAFSVYWLAWYRDQPLSWVVAQYACVGVLFTKWLGPAAMTLYWVQILLVCYAVYVAVFASRSRVVRASVLAASVAVMTAWFTVAAYGDVRVVHYGGAFAFGVLVAHVSTLVRGSVRVASAVAAVGLAALLIAGPSPTSSGKVALTIAAFLPVWWLASRVAQAIPARFVEAVSYASFAAYLFHRPVFSGIMLALPSLAGWPKAIVLGTVGTALAFVAGGIIQSGYDRVVKWTGVRLAHDGR